MDKTYEYRSQIGLPSNAGEKLFLQRLSVSVMCKMHGACNWIFDGDIDLLFKIINWEIAILLCIPLVIDGGSQYLKWRMSNQRLRLITGILCGIGIMVLEIPAMKLLMRGND